MVLVVITGVLAAIVIPRYADLQERATKAEVKALLGSGRSAILLHFTDNVVNTGQYFFELTDATTTPGVFDLSDVTDLENRLEIPPRYPPKAAMTTHPTRASDGIWSLKAPVRQPSRR